MDKNKKNTLLFITIPKYICWFFLTNLYFVICSLPLILTIVCFKDTLLTKGYFNFLIFCILEGPAITALFGTMKELALKKDLKVTKCFFKCYKTNFFKSLFISAVEVLIIFILFEYTNLILSLKGLKNITYLFYVFLFFIILINLFIFSLLPNSSSTPRKILHDSMYYLFKEHKVSLVNLIIIVAFALLTYYAPSFMPPFMFSVTSFLIIMNEKKILKN